MNKANKNNSNHVSYLKTADVNLSNRGYMRRRLNRQRAEINIQNEEDKSKDVIR